MKKNDVSILMQQLDIDENQWKGHMLSPQRIEKITSSKGVFWLKKAAPARGVFRYHALNFFSWMMRLPLLKAVPQPGGNKAIANEIYRITQLAKAGVSVPELLAYDDSWLLIKDAGQSIIKKLKQSETKQSARQELFQTCLDAMKELHKKDQYLSQGFVRNMLLDEPTQTIIFIDFEDDPLTVMSLPHAQARDVLLLVNSTARFFVEDVEFFNRAIQQFIKDHDPDMVKALKTTADRMQWITKVPFQGLLGHDYQKLKVGILALKNL